MSKSRSKEVRRHAGTGYQRHACLARSIKDLQVLVPGLAVASLMQWSRGEAGAAVALISELEGLTRKSMWRARYLPTVARILVSAGEVERAHTLLGDIIAVTTRDRNSVVAAEAIVTEARNQFARALELYDEAATRWTDFGFALERGYGLFGSGRCLLQLGRGDEAQSKLHEAAAVFTELDARPLMMEVDTYVAEGEALSS